MDKTYTTEAEIHALGREHAIEAIRESGCTDAPDGGWDSWIIAGWGVEGTIWAFGESVEDNENGWSESMAQKLRWYHEGAVDAAEELSSENDVDDLGEGFYQAAGGAVFHSPES
jgi:hypothetical protein